LGPRQIRIVGTKQGLATALVDVADPEWAEFVVEDLAQSAVERGFDGFFLDTLDTVEEMARRSTERAETFRNGLVQLIARLNEKYPDKTIVVNRGFSLRERLIPLIDGLLVESVFQTYHFSSEKYKPVEPEVTEQLLREIAPYAAAGLEVMVLDYVDPAKPDLAKETARRIQELGYSALISTPELDGVTLAPITEQPRRVFSLYGNDPRNNPDAVRWPIDSFNVLRVQPIREWLCYEMDSHHAFTQPPPESLGEQYAAILTDLTLEIPVHRQGAYVDWLIQCRQRGLKLIFIGQIPITEEKPRRRLFDALGIQGNGNRIFGVQTQAFQTRNESVLDYEAEVRLNPAQTWDLRAPAGVKPHLSLLNELKDGSQMQFDPIFAASWGGVLHKPHLMFTWPDRELLWVANPFAFFKEALDAGFRPIPDPTTRDGHRLFYSHIDGDGFANGSEVDRGRLAAEVILDRILTQYPIPVTFSVVEAEIRGDVPLPAGIDPERLKAIARSIFALPNVQAASHTYSHPFYWLAEDAALSGQPKQTLSLKTEYQLNLRREIHGSVEFIRDELLPPGKELELFLWSGNCRVTPEAIRMTKRLGLENMNGGDTQISAAQPSVMHIAPRTVAWDGQVQVYAANQNENVYTRGWRAPYYGTFINLLDTFERTETPRRLKPVNVYYHAYCGAKPASLRALERIYDWALEQELHAVTAGQYARIVLDRRRTRVFQRGPRHWILLNEGKLRTFRLPDYGWYPDMEKSSGVTGFNRDRDRNVVYLHTDGSRRVDLMLAKGETMHPYLVSSTAEIKFDRFTSDNVDFVVNGYRRAAVVLGGYPPYTGLKVRINQGQPTKHRTDDSGRIRLELPAKAEVQLGPET
jgi:hypothetical protein